MAGYLIKDPLGIKHVPSPVGEGEFTFCGIEYGCGSPKDSMGNDTDFGSSMEFNGQVVSGAATCVHCRDAVRLMRQAVSGTRFSSRLRDLEVEFDEMENPDE